MTVNLMLESDFILEEYTIKGVETIRIFNTEHFGEILSLTAGDDIVHFRLDTILDWSVEQ